MELIKLFKINFLFILFFSASASAASFDCNKAETDIEIQICSSETLNLLDEKMAVVYKKAKAISSDGLLIKEQRDWMKERNTCSSLENIEGCLVASYEDRIKFLQDFIDQDDNLSQESIGSKALNNDDIATKSQFNDGNKVIEASSSEVSNENEKSTSEVVDLIKTIAYLLFFLLLANIILKRGKDFFGKTQNNNEEKIKKAEVHSNAKVESVVKVVTESVRPKVSKLQEFEMKKGSFKISPETKKSFEEIVILNYDGNKRAILSRIYRYGEIIVSIEDQETHNLIKGMHSDGFFSGEDLSDELMELDHASDVISEEWDFPTEEESEFYTELDYESDDHFSLIDCLESDHGFNIERVFYQISGGFKIAEV